MSVVTFQVGQAGNQIGTEMFSMLAKYSVQSDELFRDAADVKSTKTSKTKEGKRIARSVLIDMEPKVIQDCFTLTKSKDCKFRFSKKNFFYKQSGSANNWGFGYSKQGPSCKKEVRKIVRKEVEKCDKLSGFLVLSSLAGGTGSGVGTYLSELIHDEYRNNVLTNLIVWPYDYGEITIQNYNTVLSLSHLSEVSDCIWFFQNDFLHQICSNELKIKKVRFKDLNRVIATITSSVLLPSFRFKTDKKVRVLFDHVDYLCSHPSYKFVTTKYYPFVPAKSLSFQNDSWNSVLKQNYQMMISKKELVNWKVTRHNVNKCISSVLTVRGDGVGDLNVEVKPFTKPHKSLFVDWYAKKHKCIINSNRQKFLTSRSASITKNSQSIVEPLDTILEKTSSMFQSKAYLHHYKKYGIEEDDFISHLSKLEKVLFDYKKI